MLVQGLREAKNQDRIQCARILLGETPRRGNGEEFERLGQQSNHDASLTMSEKDRKRSLTGKSPRLCKDHVLSAKAVRIP